MSDIQITRKWLVEKDACGEVLEYFDRLGVESMLLIDFINKLKLYGWKIWIITRSLTTQNNVKFAKNCVACAAYAEYIECITKYTGYFTVDFAAEYTERAAKWAAKCAAQQNSKHTAYAAEQAAKYAEGTECVASTKKIISYGLKLIEGQER